MRNELEPVIFPCKESDEKCDWVGKLNGFVLAILKSDGTYLSDKEDVKMANGGTWWFSKDKSTLFFRHEDKTTDKMKIKWVSETEFNTFQNFEGAFGLDVIKTIYKRDCKDIYSLK